MRQTVSAAFLGQARASVAAAAKDVCQFAQCREQIDQTESRDRPAHEVVGEQGSNRGDGFDEVVAVPESRPGDENQQETCFEKQGDEQQTSKQGGLPFFGFGPGFREMVNPARHITVAAGFGFEVDEHSQGARGFADFLERVGQIV